MGAKWFTEQFDCTFEDITESVKDLPPNVQMRVRALAHRAGRVTENGNLYPVERYMVEAARLKPMMDDGKVLMYGRHPKITEEGGKVKVESMSPTDAVAMLRSLEVVPVEGESGTADIFIEMDIPNSKADAVENLAAFIKAGAKIPISSRARGTSTKLLLTDKHPSSKYNEKWIGREVNLIGEDFRLKTYDTVEVAASEGSGTIDYREEEEEVMDFDVKKLTKENKEEIMKSDFVKEALKAAVDEASTKLKEDLDKEYEEKIQKGVDEQVAAFIKSDEFKEMAKEIWQAEGDEEGDEQEAGLVCSGCKAPLSKGDKFCSACGVAVKVAKPKESSPEEKDAEMEMLKKENEDLKKSVEELKGTVKEVKDERDDEKGDKVVDQKIAEGLKGKPAVVVERVKTLLDVDKKSKILDENTVEEQLKKRVDFVEGMFKDMGYNETTLNELAGKAKAHQEDDKDDKGKKELSEEQKAQSKHMKGMQ